MIASCMLFDALEFNDLTNSQPDFLSIYSLRPDMLAAHIQMLWWQVASTFLAVNPCLDLQYLPCLISIPKIVVRTVIQKWNNTGFSTCDSL